MSRAQPSAFVKSVPERPGFKAGSICRFLDGCDPGGIEIREVGCRAAGQVLENLARLFSGLVERRAARASGGHARRAVDQQNDLALATELAASRPVRPRKQKGHQQHAGGSQGQQHPAPDSPAAGLIAERNAQEL